MMPSTSGYNLRPNTKVESQPSSEKRIQQGEPVRSRGNREQHYSPYAEEQRRPGGRSTKSRRGQQQHCQERTGANSSKIPRVIAFFSQPDPSAGIPASSALANDPPRPTCDSRGNAPGFRASYDFAGPAHTKFRT
ncbi:hypothetical protein TNIN_425031 [Trichonephila inaurata madagascariensis]|uniref:Uncharacterized protein n=1 Tax=Trichonephila inaurata madagascariensis TaxID=2747483 RepID=A0A8X6WUS0_9ARAC|nr:hypothetical protein TNIN_425031 [Trichonephila inaurata madagascariensis]